MDRPFPDSLLYTTWNLKIHQLYKFDIYTSLSSKSGNERWQLMLKFVPFNDVHFPDLNPNSDENVRNVKLYLNVSKKSVSFSANNQGLQL